jgi:RNAse (barnase) inhibitor barstar
MLMMLVELDAARWKTQSDLYDALATGILAPPGHGRGATEIVDSLVHGGMGTIEPPLRIRIRNLHRASRAVVEEVLSLRDRLQQACDGRRMQGVEAEIDVEIT